MPSKRRESLADSFHEQSERLAAIVDSSEDAIIGKTLDGTITSWNKAAERMFGYTAQEIVGRPITTLAPPGMAEDMLNILNRIRRGERVEHYETKRRRKDGQIIDVALTVSPIRDAAGQIVGASKIAREITERKLAELERLRLLESERQARAMAEEALARHRDIEQKLGVLVDASGALLGSLEVRQVYDQTIALAKQFVAADAYAVWRADASLAEWAIVASDGLSEEYCRSSVFIAKPGQGFADTIFAIEDVAQNPFTLPRSDLYGGEGIRSLMAAPMRIHGVNSGAVTIYFRVAHSFNDTELRIMTALANLAASAVSSAELYEQQSRMRSAAEASARRAKFLARASGVLGASLDYAETLRSVAKLAVPEFADWCAVDIVEPGGRVERLAIEHSDPEKVAAAWRVRERYPLDINTPSAMAEVLRNGEPVLQSEVTDEVLAGAAQDEAHLEMLRAAGIRSAIVAPMKARGRTLGAVTFVNAESGRIYGAEDLAIAEQLAARAALAVDNSQLFAEAERKRAEAQAAAQALRRSNEELEQFAYVSSHDLQEPLRNIASYAQLLAKRYHGKLDRDADEFLGYLIDGARRMSVLIQDLLSYSRQVRMGVAAFTPVNTEEALATALRDLQRAIRDSRAEIQHDPLPTVWGHAIQLAQVFQNLISNAIKYSGGNTPKVHISVQISDGHAVFCVADQGIGIDPKYHDRIFGLFKRLHGRNVPGTGIGLATCKKIVEQHGGRIWVESKAGEGAAFYFSVPLCGD
jgi:PAS domain S-box-containing protein